jgi:hypothetical protein
MRPFAARPDKGGLDSISRRQQLSVLQEMLGCMESLTAAGQHYTMEKVVTCLGQQIGSHVFAVGARNEQALTQLLQQLACDLEPVLPDFQRCKDRAESLIGLLTAGSL